VGKGKSGVGNRRTEAVEEGRKRENNGSEEKYSELQRRGKEAETRQLPRTSKPD
jgi:hypothetical protein